MGFLAVVSAIFGWIYFLCWSLSFYPQALLNYRRKSTSGTTVDFPMINTLGFAAYFAFNAAMFYSPVIRSQYAARNHGLTPTVQFNDVTFAAHALLLSSITASQYVPGLWRGFERVPGGTRPSRFMLGIGLGGVAGVLAVVFVVAAREGNPNLPPVDPRRDWCWLDVFYAVSYVKLVITLVKYTPQIVANWRNRSTQGWSIWQILLDFSGGVLSIAQQGLDSYMQGDWSGITGNPVKFALGNVSMLYDLVFFTQHYVLYPPGKESGLGERDGLLERGEADRRLD